MGLVDEILSVIVVIFVIVIGIIIMEALYSTYPLAAIIGVFLLIAVAIIVIVKLFADLSDY